MFMKNPPMKHSPTYLVSEGESNQEDAIEVRNKEQKNRSFENKYIFL